jgi:hypothetical protein
MPMRRQHVFTESKLPLYLRPGELARVQAIVRGALRVALASSLAAVGCATPGTGEEPATHGQTQAGGAGAAAPKAGSSSPGPVARLDGGATPAADGGAAQPTDGVDGGAPAAGGAGAAGMGGAAAAGSGAPMAMEVRPTCPTGQVQFMRGLTPAEPFDYAAWRTRFGAGPSTTGVPDVQAEGMACANATDKTKCVQALAATEEGLMATDNCGQIGACRHYIVTSQGDTVKRYATRAELLSFLGPIDSAQDAMLVVHYDGFLLDCMRTLVTEEDGGFRVVVRQVTNTCPVEEDLVQLHVSADGTVKELAREEIPQTVASCVGRRPQGLVPQRACADTLMGVHFAAMAELEAASVHAFERLADELSALSAPARLVDAAREAARDEIRHALQTAAIARRYGAVPNLPKIEPRPLRDLEALALDNAVEGCVRETFGAAVGCMQALSARDPEIAQAMHEIAADETRHAALARELDAWLLPQLSGAARAQVAAARCRAVSELETEIACEPDPTLRELAGLPSRQQAALLHDVLRRELWSFEAPAA